MQLSKEDMLEMAKIIANEVVAALKNHPNNLENPKPEKTVKTAYQKTEQLMYNYNGFKRIIREKEEKIAELRAYGVPKNCSVREYVQKGNVVNGIVLEEESVEQAVANVRRSVQGTVQVVAMIDECMAALKNDPYYPILEMRYFEGRTQEDIALELKCTQSTVAKNKSRLIRELSMRIFPDQVVDEYLS